MQITVGFNPRLPWGRRPSVSSGITTETWFQSTPSGGKATFVVEHQIGVNVFQSTPSGGKATGGRSLRLRAERFQSTPSGGKATVPMRVFYRLRAVSIHAFRGEGDGSGARPSVSPRSFNPRLPGGRRRALCPHRRRYRRVSIHAFRGEGDLRRRRQRFNRRLFQSTPSGGKATCGAIFTTCLNSVSIHAFRGEGDPCATLCARSH